MLDKFQEHHNSSTLRLAISTLAPDTQGVSLTNRIQKEVLKQLVYSARSRTLRHSRFRRRTPLPWWRALVEALLAVGGLLALLLLLGRLPSHIAGIADHSTLQRIMVWTVVAALLCVALAVLRTITHNRVVVSEISAAGATFSLSAPTNTYFDEYLDEVVYFFDQEPKDFVIFEDLDRYNDPQIFQALRELNTLLNNTPKRLDKIDRHNNPLRFIYAMRDSLFEKIGEETAERAASDAAHAENIRANRTKFFELVIPVVPFISHRSAREHLHRLLRDAQITDIDRSLVELVAKHVTDMRLLINIRNEYLVFAARLLKSDKVAPELSANQLFALVAYKNFHLEDFEDISRRASDLDRVYDFHRRLVAAAVAKCEHEKRDLLTRNAPPPAIFPLANKLGGRLVALGHAERDRNNWTGMQLGFVVNSERHNEQRVTEPAFWDAVVEARSITVQANQNQLIVLSQAHLEGLFPEALKDRWAERCAEAVERQLERLDRQIDFLRGANFQDLTDDETVPLAVSANANGQTDAVKNVTFAEFVDETLRSELARDLVKHGYVDQNFTLYATQFYGDFTGVDVATFIVQTVQTNSIDINYRFSGPAAIANLLAETDEDFTHTISAYNVQVLDYLLVQDPKRADEVVKHVTTKFGTQAREFLAAFFTANGERARLAARMGHRGWQQVFTYLSADEGVPADARASLVDAALLSADPDGTYDFGSEFTDFVTEHYEEMSAFTAPHSRSELDTLVRILQRAGIRLPSLGQVDHELQRLLVANELYELTAANLRTALGISGEVTLDQARDNDAVYRYCLTNLNVYLDAIEADDDTDYSVQTSRTLVAALNVAVGAEETVKRITATASPDAALRKVTDAPSSTWPDLAAADMFRGSLTNVEAYRAEIGAIDENLGQLLVSAGSIDNDTDDAEETETPDKAATAIAVLNARGGIPSPEDRVQLVRSLGLDGPLPAAQITPEDSDLFALLIEHELVADDATTFAHLRAAGWASVEPAIVASRNIESFITPDLVDGMIASLLTTAETGSRLGQHVIAALADYVPADDRDALVAASEFAIETNTALPVEQIRRIAMTAKNPELTVRLLQTTAPDANDIVDVLNELGGEYSYLSNWERAEFELPYDEAHKAVLTILQDANVCKINKKQKHRKPIFVVVRS
ncbi:hypothetical protein A5787_23520 [Mycobacterium sp. 852002-50816_SCH5313054-b]|nr:hypothetical protein A5787_23520 [Mycobacterium sp. 852002-50816_SCH5313054-b]